MKILPRLLSWADFLTLINRTKWLIREHAHTSVVYATQLCDIKHVRGICNRSNGLDWSIIRNLKWNSQTVLRRWICRFAPISKEEPSTTTGWSKIKNGLNAVITNIQTIIHKASTEYLHMSSLISTSDVFPGDIKELPSLLWRGINNTKTQTRTVLCGGVDVNKQMIGGAKSEGGSKLLQGRLMGGGWWVKAGVSCNKVGEWSALGVASGC